jgi:glycosyltransferase involved in cell wall biosynthesis
MADKSALIVIPTTGAAALQDAVRSALAQTHPNTDVWAVIDGADRAPEAQAILSRHPAAKILQLPVNTGANGWYGHRIYAAVSFLHDHDYVLYLDQDNWLDPDHVASTVAACETNGWDWCHSLRRIHRPDGSYLCDDDCESLGRHPVFYSDADHLVDTSCYCIRKEVMISMAPAWYVGWGGDRLFYSALSRQRPNFGCTGKATSCYRLSNRAKGVTADFFQVGNSVMRQKYPQGFPWRR